MSIPRLFTLHFQPGWRQVSIAACLVILACGTAAYAAAPEAPVRARTMRKSFDIPAGEAFTTLKRFFAQSGEQVIYRADALEGVTTAAVKGEFTPHEALDRMLRQTGFSVTRDEQTGVLAIKAPARGNSRNDSAPPPAPDSPNSAKKKTIP